MTGTERIFKTLQLKEPDRVPHFEIGVDEKVREAIFPGSSYRDFVERLDWDAVTVDDRLLPGWRVENLDASGKYFRDQWGGARRMTAEALAHPAEAAVKSEKDLDKWRLP